LDLEEEKFIADAMLGKLAKWLRVMGYDTHYQSFYPKGSLLLLWKEGRRLLSRHRHTIDLSPDAIFIRSNPVGKQLQEVKKKLGLRTERSKWFTRCLVCNVLLQKADRDSIHEKVPEFVFYQNSNEIRFCSRCDRYYWPGSHRANMTKQLEEWGF
jgi:uncharacterized protein